MLVQDVRSQMKLIDCNPCKTLNMRCCLVRSWMITDIKMLMQDVRSQMKVK